MTWLGTATGIAGAILLAANLGDRWVVAGYSFFLASSLIWASVARRRKDQPLFWMQTFFCCVNVFGLVRWTA